MGSLATEDACLGTLSIVVSPSARAFIKTAGFKSLCEITNSQPLTIARELGMDPHRVLELVDEIKACCKQLEEPNSHKKKPRRFYGMTALSLLDEYRTAQRHIVTYSHEIDVALGGGIPIGEVTELCGIPGSGKTQLAMQAAVDVCIPQIFGGLGGECMYIDTEGSFSAERTFDIATAVYRHLERVSKMESGKEPSLRQRQVDDLMDLSVEKIMEKVKYCRVHNHNELVAVVLSLQKLVQSNPALRLIIVDSIAFHFRQEFENMAVRTRLLNSISQTLNNLASNQSCAILVTNQMTTKIVNSQRTSSIGGSQFFAPALGESWSHAITNRLLLERTDVLYQEKPRRSRSLGDRRQPGSTITTTVRKMSLTKSPYLPPKSCNFIITGSGIRDVRTSRQASK